MTSPVDLSKISVPTSRQHKTAGPYSPVLQIDASRLVVISGQVSVDLDGKVVGKTIEEQTLVTLRNCETQLKNGGSGLEHVFKVNVYLTDLEMWERFNAVYTEVMPEPLPARTAVQTKLLPGFIVEVEMWAVLP